MGDPCRPSYFPFLDDLSADCLIPLADANCIPFDDDSLEQLKIISQVLHVSMVRKLGFPDWLSISTYMTFIDLEQQDIHLLDSYLRFISFKHIILVCGVSNCMFWSIIVRTFISALLAATPLLLSHYHGLWILFYLNLNKFLD